MDEFSSLDIFLSLRITVFTAARVVAGPDVAMQEATLAIPLGAARSCSCRSCLRARAAAPLSPFGKAMIEFLTDNPAIAKHPDIKKLLQ